jgi:L-rhamnose-H+ transport protein
MAIILIGGALSGSFAVPMKRARRWQWENTWLIFSLICLVFLPWALASGFVSHLVGIYRGLPGRALFYPVAFGLLWGIAQVTYGLAIRAVGMAFAIAIVAAISCLSGSLIPLLAFNPTDLLRPRGLLLLVSMPILLLGLALYGMAGRRREKEQTAAQGAAARLPGRSFAAGLGICIFTGVFGSSINLGFAFSAAIIQRSLDLGVGPVTSTYAVWALVLGAGFVPNFLYCTALLSRNQRWSLFIQTGWTEEMFVSLVMAILFLGGILAYGVGAKMVGLYGTSLGFALYISGMILSSNVMGIVSGEWKSTSVGTRRLLAGAVGAILISVVVLNVGGVF